MNHQFDQFTKDMAQSVTRRAALKKLGVGLASMALACFGMANKAEAEPGGKNCFPSGTACGFAPKRQCSKCCNGYTSDLSGFICL